MLHVWHEHCSIHDIAISSQALASPVVKKKVMSFGMLEPLPRQLQDEVGKIVAKHFDEVSKDVDSIGVSKKRHEAVCEGLLSVDATLADEPQLFKMQCGRCVDLQRARDAANTLLRKIWLGKEIVAGMNTRAHVCDHGCRKLCDRIANLLAA